MYLNLKDSRDSSLVRQHSLFGYWQYARIFKLPLHVPGEFGDAKLHLHIAEILVEGFDGI
tara:strand:- start:56 stop:235 length:180 start_codon:yes stop_codon:yes gene_type:complete